MSASGPTHAPDDVLHRALLDDLTDGCATLRSALADAWFSERAAVVASLADHLAAARIDDAARVAHRLKGSLGTLAAQRAADAAARLDAACRAGELTAARTVHAQLIDEIERFEDALRALVRDEATPL